MQMHHDGAQIFYPLQALRDALQRNAILGAQKPADKRLSFANHVQFDARAEEELFQPGFPLWRTAQMLEETKDGQTFL